MSGKKKNYVGFKSGKLKAIEFTYTKGRKSYYKCLCECGKFVEVRQDRLTSKDKVDCGCINRNPPGSKSKSWHGYGEMPKVYWSRCKYGAETRSVKFKLSMKEMWKKFLEQNGKCALTGVTLKFDSKSQARDGNASLDRIDSKKGYTKDNIQWIDKWINIMKNDFSVNEFITLCNNVTSFNK